MIMVSMSTINRVFGTLQKKSWWQGAIASRKKNVTQFVLSCGLKSSTGSFSSIIFFLAVNSSSGKSSLHFEMWHGVDAEMRSGSTMAYSNATIGLCHDFSRQGYIYSWQVSHDSAISNILRSSRQRFVQGSKWIKIIELDLLTFILSPHWTRR